MSLSTGTRNYTSRSATCSVGDLTERLGERPVVAAIWAHPDDESYLGGGLMASVARRGGQVVNVCATLGEHGTQDPERFPTSRLAPLRRRELTSALSELGAGSPIILGYADGECSDVPIDLGAQRVATVLDEIRPDVVLTFGRDGVTGHPDHIAVARWTAEAVIRHGNDVALVTTAAGAAWPTDLIDGMHSVEAFYPGYPERGVDDPTWTVRVEGDLLDRKLAALHAHQSQIGPLHAALGPEDYRRLASIEAYSAANEIALQMLSGPRARLLAAA